MIWDTFLFGGELDLLECRLTELQDVPDLVHVIVESAVTFQGDLKPLHYKENQARFSGWSNRIRYVVAEPEGSTPWQREWASREACRRGLDGATSGDVVLHGDVDEIPSADAVHRAVGALKPSVFIQRMFQFAVDWELPGGWYGTSAADWDCLPSFRWLREGGWAPLPDGGWHLSWLGGGEAVTAKVRAYSHAELSDHVSAGANGFYERGRGLVPASPPVLSGRMDEDDEELRLFQSAEMQLQAVNVDSSWPRWVSERRCPGNWFRPR